MYPYKNKDLEVNIQTGTIKRGNHGILFYSEDKGTASIRIKITDNNRNIDFTKIDLVPYLDLFMEDGSIFKDEEFRMIAPQYGQVQYDIPKNIIRHVGQVHAKIILKNSNKSIHVADFYFTIGDSGIEGAVEKEVSVNIVDDAVRRIIQENAIELLGSGFKDDVSVELKDYVTSNTELFKGPKGDEGKQGQRGPQGLKGDTGEQGPQGDKGEKGVVVSDNTDIVLLNGITAQDTTKKPTYRIFDYGDVKTITIQGGITNVPAQQTIYIGQLPIKPIVDVFMNNSYNGATLKVLPNGTISVNCPSGWKPENILYFNGTYTV